ncbi:MAG: hypothetical protein LAQ30_14025, partial [Acidobacteriia bacterium]|nr:hypothetical protein [Terriglobia bacterium]
MRVLAAVAGLVLLFIVLADAFTTIVLARRTQRTLRLTRYFYRLTWWAYATPGRRIRDGESREDYLSIYGPLSFLVLLGTWAVGAIAAFGLFQWSREAGVQKIMATGDADLRGGTFDASMETSGTRFNNAGQVAFYNRNALYIGSTAGLTLALA